MMIPNIEQTAMRKVYLRLLPFSVLCMFVCYLDRVNVGFAALTMNKDLGLSAYFFGLGAGAFYGGYCLFGAISSSSGSANAFGSPALCRRVAGRCPPLCRRGRRNNRQP
jgi:hypothetical protein